MGIDDSVGTTSGDMQSVDLRHVPCRWAGVLTQNIRTPLRCCEGIEFAYCGLEEADLGVRKEGSFSSLILRPNCMERQEGWSISQAQMPLGGPENSPVVG